MASSATSTGRLHVFSASTISHTSAGICSSAVALNKILQRGGPWLAVVSTCTDSVTVSEGRHLRVAWIPIVAVPLNLKPQTVMVAVQHVPASHQLPRQRSLPGGALMPASIVDHRHTVKFVRVTGTGVVECKTPQDGGVVGDTGLHGNGLGPILAQP